MSEELISITRSEHRRLERRSQILAWIDGDFIARRAGPALSELVGRMLDSGDSLQKCIDTFARQPVRPRRAQQLAERETRRRFSGSELERAIESAPSVPAAPDHP